MSVLLYMLLALGLLMGFQWLKNKKIQQKQLGDFLRIFGNSQFQLPGLKFGSSYGWPTYSITFLKEEDMRFAEKNGLIEQFKSKVKSYYDNKFDPERAVNCTYVGYEPAWKVSLDEDLNRQKKEN